ncbi:MAG: NYN domain-containing protein [Deferribacteraceae bacterium]|jgi:uncharacterized LabA/DUF88 family protein|nr:NYN domain-containing protein [Deferribacteraceae bacterium]
MRTNIYIDGINLYYLALKGHGKGFKWLNPDLLCRSILPQEHYNIVSINYYTARVSPKASPTAPRDQQVYINALESLPNLKIHYGRFTIHPTKMFMVQPAQFEPPCTTPPTPNPKFVYVQKTEEKGSDVNIAAHLVRDACLGAFDNAVVITNDTDLVEPIRIVTQELKRNVVTLNPSTRPAQLLLNVSTYSRRIHTSHIKQCQFPDSFTHNGKLIEKPKDW